MDLIVSAACDLLREKKSFVLATIIQQQGSAPRTSGTQMLITTEKKFVGTIGGGLLEAETIQAAARMNQQTSTQAPARLLNFDMTNTDAANMEMICGGRVKVLLDLIRPTDENRNLFTAWRTSLSQGQETLLVSIITGREAHIERIEHVLVGKDKSVQGSFTHSEMLPEKLEALRIEAAHVQVFNLKEVLLVAVPGRIAPILYIFGAGHVAQPTARLAAMVGFDVAVLDDRSEFASAARFPEAMTVRTLSSFDAAFEGLAVNRNSYIIIVTRGHLHDRTVLAQALKTPAAYIGMIGSRRKRDTIYDRLLQNGYTSTDIARVHCPIGLSIGADTPEEIAVSIAAELIAVRAGV